MNFISSVIFVGLENLDQLVLNHNELIELNAKWFKGLEKLHDLKICNNKMGHIDNAAFEGLEGKISWSQTVHILPQRIKWVYKPDQRDVINLLIKRQIFLYKPSYAIQYNICKEDLAKKYISLISKCTFCHHSSNIKITLKILFRSKNV